MSESRPQVVLALTPPAERAVEELLFGPDAPIVPVASIAEADELERLLDSGYTAVLLSPELSGLSAGHAARVRAAGLRLVGVALDERDERTLAALGADALIKPGCSPEQLRAAVADENSHVPPASGPVQAPAANGRRGDGSVVAVVGSKGAPGTSECAASLAALSSGRWPTLLVELDSLGGTLGLRLGTEPAEGSVLAVARALAAGERGLGELVERWLCRRQGWPAALPHGEPAEEAAATLAQPGAVRLALEALTEISPVCIVDVGFLLAEAGELGLCCQIHREALVCADAVVLVLGARDPQLEAGLAQLDLLLGPLALLRERLWIVVNGLGGPGTSAARDLQQALLDRLAARKLTADAWLPWDRRALRRAEAGGLPLAVARPRGPFARELARFLEELFLPTAPAAREQKRRLPPPRRRDDQEVPLPWRS